MPLYVGDYLKDTRRFTAEQHGAYFLLLMEEWTQGPLPTCDDDLAAICHIPKSKFLKAIKGVVMAKFTLTDEGFVQKRLEVEKQKAVQRSIIKATNGKLGGRPKSMKENETIKPTGFVEVKLNGTKSKAEPNLNESSSPSPSQSPSQEGRKKDSDPPSADRPKLIQFPDPGPAQPGLGLEVSSPSHHGSIKLKVEAPTSAVWHAYADAYRQRHGTQPIRNAKVSGQLAQFLKRVPMEEAPDIASFYVSINDSFLIRSMHPIDLLLRNAEAYRTQWFTGKAMTSTKAQQVDRKQTAYNSVGEAKEIIRQRHTGS